MINILNKVAPHKVSRDLSGYSVFFYGTPKSGKTTIASKFPGALLLAFEKGYNAIPGVNPIIINSWKEFKIILKELKEVAQSDSEEAIEIREKFKTIIVDTVDIAFQYCSEFICNLHGVDEIGAIPFGRGYTYLDDEFDKALRMICNLDYGLVLISHSKDKTYKDETGEEYSRIVPTIDDRGARICSRTCDIIGYSRTVETAKGLETRLFMRETPRYVAGSRFKYIPNSIEFTYSNLTKAITEAIDQEAAEHDNKFVTEEESNLYLTDNKQPLPFSELKQQFDSLVEKLMSNNVPAQMAPTITRIVEKHLGKGKKVAECTPAQVDQIELILYDLKEYDK